MKQAITLITIFFLSIAAFAQTDSMYVKSHRSFRLQEVDAATWGSFISYNCETIFHQFYPYYNNRRNPSPTEVLVADSVEYKDLIRLYRFIRFQPTSPSTNRTLDSLRLQTEPFVQRNFNDIDQEKVNRDLELRFNGRIAYRRGNN